MFRAFFARPWIKNEVLNYLFDKEKYQKTPVRAQVIRFINSEPNELKSAEIHDNRHYIKCFFTDESLYEFNRHNIDHMVGTLIIIKDYTFSHEIDSSKNKHECFLTIKNFAYTKNITDSEEQVKNICEEMEVKEILQAKDNKSKHIDHPGWNGFRHTFYSNSVDIRTVPPYQYKLMSDIPGWNFTQRNETRKNDLCVKIESTEWSPGSPESPRHDSDGAISLNDEDIAVIMKGNYKEKDTLDDEEVHFERTKRKYVDKGDDDTSSKKHKNPSTFCSYV
ncbi:hypothetical protein RclHR1_00730032 [Rhizophagus clarus]|uniref:Shelterin complex subunit TPP1/Est3 domain-containing protein n=1 Tax=Rhizophagus clarus TaxID=94130 RepID=A0A2Z6S2B8_9GLOM|nr:hypothetical protein RclHR1_00730032 [Rhizophagus clarus]GES86701.1 hypothetical protein GLOIN_2v1659654 [Rhizophagus clarus]